jgi:superfamily II DNA or RNA helicase
MLVEIHVQNIKSQLVVVFPDGSRGKFPSTPAPEGKEIEHPVVRALDKELRYETELLIQGRLQKVPVKRFSTKTYKFDTGCVSFVSKILKTFQQPYKYVDKRTPVVPGVELPFREGVLPRPYQEEATNIAIKSQRGVLRLATGAGKTFIAWNILRKLNLPTVIFVHTIDLLDQFAEAGEFFLNVPIGRIGNGQVNIQQFTVCMMQTCIRAFDEKYVKYEVDPEEDYDEDSIEYSMQEKQRIRNAVEQAAVVISDECHHLSSSTLQTLFKSAKNAFYRYGLTATMREDGADLIIYGVTGKIIYEVTATFLIEHDPPYLVRPTIYYMKVPRRKGSDGNYHTRYKTDIVEYRERNELAVQATMRLVKKGFRVLVLARQIKHLKLLREMLAEGFGSQWPDIKDMDSTKIQYELATGAVNKLERKRIIKAMKDNQLECLFASTIADEGLDCPPISAVVMAGGGKSATKSFQRVGRALRLFPGKDRAVIIDFHDQGKYFKKHAERRMELFKKEPAFEIKIQE